MRKRLFATVASLGATVIFAVQANAAVVFLNENFTSATLSSGGTRVDLVIAVDCFPTFGDVNPRITSVSASLQQELSTGEIVGGSDFHFTNVPCDGSKHFFDFEIFQNFFQGQFRSWECGPGSKPADARIVVGVTNGTTTTFVEFKPEIDIDCF